MSAITAQHFTDAAINYPEADRLVLVGDTIKPAEKLSLMGHLVSAFDLKVTQEDIAIRNSFRTALLKEHPAEDVNEAFHRTLLESDLGGGSIMSHPLSSHTIRQIKKHLTESAAKVATEASNPPPNRYGWKNYGTFEDVSKRRQ